MLMSRAWPAKKKKKKQVSILCCCFRKGLITLFSGCFWLRVMLRMALWMKNESVRMPESRKKKSILFSAKNQSVDKCFTPVK